MKVGRNDPCHCGSGLKYKKCHLLPDEAAHSAELAAQRAAAAPASASEVAADEGDAGAPAARPAAPVRTANGTVRAKAQAMRQPGAARRRAV